MPFPPFCDPKWSRRLKLEVVIDVDGGVQIIHDDVVERHYYSDIVEHMFRDRQRQGETALGIVFERAGGV